MVILIIMAIPNNFKNTTIIFMYCLIDLKLIPLLFNF